MDTAFSILTSSVVARIRTDPKWIWSKTTVKKLVKFDDFSTKILDFKNANSFLSKNILIKSLYLIIPDRQHWTSTHFSGLLNSRFTSTVIFAGQLTSENNRRHHTEKVSYWSRIPASTKYGTQTKALCLPILGLFQTTRGTPDLETTFPPAASIRASSFSHSGLWSLEIKKRN